MYLAKLIFDNLTNTFTETLLKPLDYKTYSENFCSSFSSTLRTSGADSVTFQCPVPENDDDLELGKHIKFIY